MKPHVQTVYQFKTSPQAEAKGSIMMAWLNNILVDQTRPVLTAHGITNLDPDGWYNFQTFLDMMREIVDAKVDMTSALVAVGKEAAASLNLGDFETLDTFKQFVASMHGISVRNCSEAEQLLVYEEDDELFLVNNTPTSNDIIYGFFWEILRKSQVAGANYLLVPYANYPSKEIGSTFKLKPQTI